MMSEQDCHRCWNIVNPVLMGFRRAGSRGVNAKPTFQATPINDVGSQEQYANSNQQRKTVHDRTPIEYLWNT